MTWFYAFNGERKGPIDETELHRLVTEGTILQDTLVWHEGLANWLPLQEVRPAGSQPAAARPGTFRCDSCLGYFEPSDLAEVRDCRICVNCKPAVLARFQEDGHLPEPLEAHRTGPAWEQSPTLGWFPAAKETINAVLREPSSSFATMRRTGGLARPFWFATIVGGFTTSILMIYLTIGQFAQVGTPGSYRSTQFQYSSTLFVVALVLRIGFALILVPLGSLIVSGLLHVGLKLTGGAIRPFETTYRAYCYAWASVSTLNLVPAIGSILALPWSLIVLSIALARAHETDRWRAVVALLLPVTILLLLSFVVGIGVAYLLVARRHLHP